MLGQLLFRRLPPQIEVVREYVLSTVRSLPWKSPPLEAPSGLDVKPGVMRLSEDHAQQHQHVSTDMSRLRSFGQTCSTRSAIHLSSVSSRSRAIWSGAIHWRRPQVPPRACCISQRKGRSDKIQAPMARHNLGAWFQRMGCKHPQGEGANTGTMRRDGKQGRNRRDGQAQRRRSNVTPSIDNFAGP